MDNEQTTIADVTNALLEEQGIKPPVVIPPAGEPAKEPVKSPLEDQLDKVKNRMMGKPEPAKPAETPAPKEEPVKPAEAAKPAEEPKLEGDEFIDSVLKDIVFEEPNGEPEKKDNQPQPSKDAYSIKELAQLYKVDATTPEELEKALSGKFQSTWQSSEELTKPLKDIDTVLAIADDKEFISVIKRAQGWEDADIATYLESLEDSMGKSGIKNQALEYRVGLKQSRKGIEQQVADSIKKTEDSRKTFESDIQSRALKMEKVKGVPVKREGNESFAKKVMSGEYKKVLENPDALLEMFRLYEDFGEISRSLIEKGARGGFNKAKATYDQKLFNKDISSNTQRGGIPNIPTDVTEDQYTKVKQFVQKGLKK